VRHVPPALAERAVVVGGAVRDALLGLPPGDDLDLVVEGDPGPLPGWSAHDRFGTAVQAFPEGTLHVGMARRERYPEPGALPEVEPGSLADDLARRDVTVNAMAVPLGGPGRGTLIDPHGGLGDLAAHLIRSIRPDAFHEDPSRVVRAARYASRLGFTLEPGTRSAAAAAAPALDLGSARVAGEVRRLLEEADPIPGLRMLADLGVPWIADPSAIASIDATHDDHPELAVPQWAARLAVAVRPGAAERAALPGWAVAAAREVHRGMAAAHALPADASRSEADRVLAALRPPGTLGALATGAPAARRWWREDRDRRPAIDGSDLVAAGVAPGPAIGRALAAVRAALLDGSIERDREVQLNLALRIAREHG
jgi:tRNA nucleotidyltransferase (CCA-adding enzyme)